MAITLGALALPDGLVWSDEHAWTPIEQATERTLTGALVLEEAVKQKGRPITLAGAKDGTGYTAWVARAQSFRGFASLESIRTALLVAGAEFVLTLHDGRSFTVAPRHDGEGPLSVEPLPVYRSFASPNPTAGSLYVVSAIRLIEV